MNRAIFTFLIMVFATLLLSGCAKQPTSMTKIVNDAPTVNFKVADSANLTLWVDGVSYGALAQYEYPDKAVELLTGEHRIEVRRGNNVVFSEVIYLSDKTHRTLEISSETNRP